MEDTEDDMTNISKNKPVIANPEKVDPKQKTVNQKIIESFTQREGKLSEVIDSEGHRITINHY
ncbi:hypothetical protein D3C87_1911140 [compost metagenome]